MFEDRVDCADCAHHHEQPARIKLPPPEPHLDPREYHRLVHGVRDACKRGGNPMPGWLRRCDEYQGRAV